MKLKSAYVVIAVGIIFVICSILRLFGFLVPSIVVALISVIAALVSLSDVLEITRFREYVVKIQILALILFILTMTIWLLPLDLEFGFVPAIGDCFTILGLGFVIGLYGLKEILENSKVSNGTEQNNTIEECKYNITLNEYKEMMKINDIIERLKKLDEETFPYNKVHSGWSFLSDILAEHWNRWKGPFFDGKNREQYYDFLTAMNKIAVLIAEIADADYLRSHHKNIEMYGESIEISINPIINNRYIPSINDIAEEINKTLFLWEGFKDLVNKRYEIERAEL